MGKIHNSHQGPIFDDNFKKVIDDEINSNPHLFNPHQNEIIEPGDEKESLRNITISEIKFQLSKTKGRSAPGADGIRYPVIKKCPEIVFQNLDILYNKCLKIGYFPKAWKQALGTMIPKPEKDKKITTNYRPISLLSCIGKLFEKIMANRMRRELENNNFFNQWQIGYRNKRCAMEHILRLADDAITALARGRVGAAVFIDVEKAFDSVLHNGLRHKLNDIKLLPPKIIRLMSSFITERTISIRVNDEISDEVKLNAGTPQGSVLSPLLFLIYVNDIPIDPSNNQVKLSQFADDLGMWTFASSNPFLGLRLSKTLADLEKWCAKWRIKLNTKKTQLLLLKNSKKPSKSTKKEVTLRLFGEKIEEVQKAKLLGVTLTPNMKFKRHAEIAIEKARQRINLPKLLSGTDWGCSPKTIMRLYKAFVRPVLEYGAIVLLSASPYQLKQLQIVQNRAIKIAYRLPWRASTDEIHEIAGIEPLKERYQNLANKFIHSLETNSELFKLQKSLHEINTKKNQTTFFDTIMKNYIENYK